MLGQVKIILFKVFEKLSLKKMGQYILAIMIKLIMTQSESNLL